MGFFRGHHFFQELHAGEKGLGEARFLAGDEFDNEVTARGQFGIDRTHAVDDRFDQRHHERLVQAEVAAEEGGAPQQTAQDVAAAFIRRNNAVGDEEGDAAAMLGDDAHGPIGLAANTVFGAGNFCHLVQQIIK